MIMRLYIGPGCPAVWSLGLLSLPCCDCGFESHRRLGWMSAVSVVWSGRVVCIQLIAHPEESYCLWCVVVCDRETSWMRRTCPTGGCCTKIKHEALHNYDVYDDLWLHEVHTRHDKNRSAVSKSEMAILRGTNRHATNQRHGRHGYLINAVFRFC
jgi:hypothetical protein